VNSRDSILLISPPGPEGSSSLSLFGADSLVPGATPTMWAMAGLIVAMAVGSAILFLIIRDALEDNANWLHGVGGVVIWIGLALCIEGCQVLARTISTQDGIQRGVDGDVWIAIGWRTIFYAAIPVLTLLGFALGKTFWKNRQDWKAAERARRLRGTLTRK
jgi:hypothetical protein